MAVQRKHTKKRLSDVVVHNGVAYLSGQLATNFDGDIHTQTQETLANIDRLLADVGSDKSKIISATIYLKDIGKDFGALNEVWETWVEEGTAPARACVEAAMFDPRLLVEISVIAALD
jgi:enamine deaminase RidA (YjgF/YER057c/UK114 family)